MTDTWLCYVIEHTCWLRLHLCYYTGTYRYIDISVLLNETRREYITHENQFQPQKKVGVKRDM